MRHLLLLLIGFNCCACEILVEARNRDVSTDENRIGHAQRGMIVVAKPDGWTWGTEERLPKYVVIKIPLISPAQVKKYLAEQYSGDTLYRYRLWRIRWEDLPASARNKLANNGTLTIKATSSYTGSYDYTWSQIKSYFRNLETATDETGDL